VILDGSLIATFIRPRRPRTWLITGVSSGFGRELTSQLFNRGDRVIGTVRDTSKITGLTDRYPDTFIPEMLVTPDRRQLGRPSRPGSTIFIAERPGSLPPARHRVEVASSASGRGSGPGNQQWSYGGVLDRSGPG
jgi:hypothetical protein